MKKILGIAAIVLLGSIPAYAQSKGGGVAASGNGGLNFGGGAGGIGGGGINTSGTRLPSYARAQFASAAFSGDPSFTPSGFLSFDQAVEAGKLASEPKESVAQVAADNLAATRTKSRVEFVQDPAGKVVPLVR